MSHQLTCAENNARARLILDNAPMACNFWDGSGDILDCNFESLRLFGLGSKQEFIARFDELLPEFQPDGGHSEALRRHYAQQALQRGRLTMPIPWMRRTASGEPLPSETTLVRVMEDGKPMLAVFVRDLREELQLQAETQDANEYAQLMLNATPLCCNLWNEAHDNIACNQAAADLFELKDKQEYLDRFFELSPEYQPCGGLTSELAHGHISTAFREGYTRFEWLHQKLNGEPVPAEITLVRVARNGGFIVAGYTRDLREELKLLAEKHEADERMQIMLDATPLGCILWDEETRPIDCNLEVVRLFGFSSKQEYLDHYSESDLAPVYQPDGRLSAELRIQYVQQAQSDGYARVDWMYQKLDGELIPAEVTLVRVRRAQSHNIAVYIRDLREEKKLQAEKQEAYEYQQLMLDATPLSCSLWNEACQKVACNQEAVNLFGLRDKQEYLDRFFELSPKYQPCGRLSRELAQEHVSTAFREGHCGFEWMHQQLDGEPVPVHVTLVRVAHNGGFIVAGYTRDLRELKNTISGLKRMEALAYTDKLTGVGNRHYFMEHAAPELAGLGSREAASLLILDIDHFKRVNDTYGHSAGDVILQNVAERIWRILRPDDLFARYGGEEFVILLARSNLSAALALAERVRKTIAERPFEYQSVIIDVTISIGVACGDNAATPLQDLVDQADSALYQAKRNGRNRVEHHPSASADGELVSEFDGLK